MRTYTHGVIGYLLYAKRSRQEQRLTVIGSILPDVFLALGFVPHYLEYVTQSPLVADIHTLFHHSALHTVTIAMHSFVVAGPFLALSSVLLRLSRCESKEAPCCLSTVGFIPALTRTGQAPFSASGGPTPADEASFSHAYSPCVVAASCCPSGFGMPGMSRPLPPVAAFLCLPGRA